MRKVLLAAAAVAAVAVPTTVAVAGGEDAPGTAPAAAHAAPAAPAGRDATTTALLRHKLSRRAGGYDRRAVLLKPLAARLGVTVDELRIAGREAMVGALDAVSRQSGADVAALRACVAGSTACDHRAARTQARRLHRGTDLEKLDLAAIKQGLADDAAEQLQKTPDEVLAAVRAELEAKLALGRTIGVVTPAQRTLALGCFDDPDACDVAAVRRAFRFHMRRG